MGFWIHNLLYNSLPAMKLFSQLQRGEAYIYYDKPERVLVKLDDSHSVTPAGVRKTHPHVLIFEREGETEATRWTHLRRSRKERRFGDAREQSST